MGIADLNSLAAAIIWNLTETCKQMLHESLSPLDFIPSIYRNLLISPKHKPYSHLASGFLSSPASQSAKFGGQAEVCLLAGD
jgi:hypothetical protein